MMWILQESQAMNVNLKLVVPSVIEALGNAILGEREEATIERVDMIRRLLICLDKSNLEFDNVLRSFGYYLQ